MESVEQCWNCERDASLYEETRRDDNDLRYATLTTENKAK